MIEFSAALFYALSGVVGFTIILNALILYGICVPNSVMDLSRYMEVDLLAFGYRLHTYFLLLYYTYLSNDNQISKTIVKE